MIPDLRVISQSAREEILRPLRSLRLNIIGNWVLAFGTRVPMGCEPPQGAVTATFPHWQH